MKVRVAWFLSSLMLLCAVLPARAHEVFPSIADFSVEDGYLTLIIEGNLESFAAGIDLNGLTNTNDTPEAGSYDSLRAMNPETFAAAFTLYYAQMSGQITLRAGDVALVPELIALSIPPVGDVEVLRSSIMTLRAALPRNATEVQIGWDARYGALVLRQHGPDAPYDGYLDNGALSPPIPIGGGGQVGLWQTFANYIPVGFDHILPKGLDHILFVLGLFFLAMGLRALLWQISAFTLAHTITLALAAGGIVQIPGSIVEPLIAASIVYVAVENIWAQGLSRWRPVVVFCFGLLHGLGFASVLGEFGLPEGAFMPALIGFNIGVELGQLAVICGAFALVGYWFGKKPWYRRVIAVPASAGIAVVGVFWVVQRVFF